MNIDDFISIQYSYLNKEYLSPKTYVIDGPHCRTMSQSLQCKYTKVNSNYWVKTQYILIMVSRTVEHNIAFICVSKNCSRFNWKNKFEDDIAFKIEIPHSFFRIPIFFFANKSDSNFFFVHSVFYVLKSKKKNSEWSENFSKNLFFKKH